MVPFFSETAVSIILAIAGGLTSLLCLWEFSYNAKDIFYHILNWRSVVQWLPQILVLGVTIGGCFVVMKKRRGFHFRIALYSALALPIGIITVSLSVVRTSYTVCCCTSALCMINTYRKPYFDEATCDALSESCGSGFWRLVFNFLGTWLLTLVLLANTLFHFQLHNETKRRHLDYQRFCRTTGIGLTSAQVPRV